MTEDKFWDIIEQTQSDTEDGQLAALTVALDEQSTDDIIAFQTVYYALLDKAYRWDLWAAAYVIIGGCSDDGFDYFCDWLISKGRAVFEAAIADPESLADTDLSGDMSFEEFRYTAGDVYESKAGHDMNLPMSRRGEPLGEPFDERTVDQLFPRLVGDQASANHEPLSSQRSVEGANVVLTELVGKRLTSVTPVLAPGPFRKNAGMAFYFALGRPRLESRAWTIECTDAENLSTLELVEAEMDEAKRPADEALIFERKAQIAEATQELFAGIRNIRMTVETVKRVGHGDLLLTLSNASFCRSITLHSLAGSDGNRNFSVLVKQDDDHYYL